MIPLAVPNLNGNEKIYLDNCIDTTFVSSVGEYVNEFEKMISESTGSIDSVATSSGTTGLHAALTAVGVGYGDLVIIPSFTFIATANAVRHCGADTWLMDISREDWCLSPEIVKKQIEENCNYDGAKLIHKSTGKRVTAIMPVYALGNIPDMADFRNICDEYGISLIADAACAIGARYQNECFGGLADLSVLSFNGNKTVTCGGGGAVVGTNKPLLDRVRHLTTTARVWPDYDFDMVGFNYRMTNIQAAVGVAQMEKIESFIERKRYVRSFYQEKLMELSKLGISFFPSTDGSSCWFSGIILNEASSQADAKEVCRKLKDHGIDAKIFWKPVHLQVPYSNSPKSDLFVTNQIWQRIITLPCSTGITDDELETVANTLLKVFA